MARLRGHESLKPDKTLYVLRPGLLVGDSKLEVGAVFKWQDVPDMTPRTLRLLHDQRWVGHERPDDPGKGAEDIERTAYERRWRERDARAAKKVAPIRARVG